MKMRTINEASAYLYEQDPKTALTKTAIRRLVVSGVVPSVRIGSKYLIDMEQFERYLSSGISQGMHQDPVSGTIRKVEVSRHGR